MKKEWTIYKTDLGHDCIDPIGLLLDTDTLKNNANLIAAAPDMLEALIYVSKDDGCPPDVADVILHAIAKAKGELS